MENKNRGEKKVNDFQLNDTKNITKAISLVFFRASEKNYLLHEKTAFLNTFIFETLDDSFEIIFRQSHC